MRQHERIMFDLRDCWQGRVLAAAKGSTRSVVLSVLSHTYDEAVLPLLQALYPGFNGILPPFLCSAGRISRGGKVYADMVTKTGQQVRRVIVFSSETALQNAFRHLADEVKLTDAERVEMFAVVKKWIICDYRIDPNTGMKEERAA